MPLKPESIRDLVAFLANPATTSFPQFWNANPTAEFVALSGADTEHPIRLALALALPIAGCWLIVRNPLLLLEFALVYLGIELFANIWNFPGRARHHGAVFLALIAAAWSARARHSPTTSSSWTLAALLVVNAFAGVLTVASELRPFSEGYNAAAWIKQNNLADAFLIGSRDAQVQTVAGYLGRSIYYLECDCLGTFVVWNEEREDALSADEFWRRLHKAASLAGQREAILIRYQPIAPDDLKAAAPSLSLTLLHSFANAAMYPGWTEGAENFWIYRVSVEKPP